MQGFEKWNGMYKPGCEMRTRETDENTEAEDTVRDGVYFAFLHCIIGTI